MKNYKITQCRVESLKPGDMVLSRCTSGNDAWFSFIFNSISPINHEVNKRICVTHPEMGNTTYTYSIANSLFYKVEKSFPSIWGESIDKYNLNIGL